VYIGEGTGASIAAARGSCLRIVDTTTNGADSFVAYISTTANDGLLIDTGHANDINLKLSSSAAGAAQMLYVDGVTGTWVGANGVGQVEVTGDGVLAAGASMLRVYHATGAPTAASYLVDITGAGTWAGSTNGTCLRITDSGAVAGTSSAVYINSTANNGLNVVTGAVAASNIICSGVQAQTAPIVKVDGTTGTGWDGAANVGMLDVNLTAATIATTASAVYIGQASGAAIADSRGHLLRINDASTQAGTMGYPVSITSTAAASGGVIITTAATGNAIAVTAGKVDLDDAVLLGGIAAFNGTPQTLTGAGAANLTTTVTLTITAGDDVVTLANGTYAGQIKIITLKTITTGGDTTIVTPDGGGSGWTTATLDAVGDSVTMMYIDSKWHVISSFSATIA